MNFLKNSLLISAIYFGLDPICSEIDSYKSKINISDFQES